MADFDTLPDESNRYTEDLATAEDVNWVLAGAHKKPLAFLTGKLNENAIAGVIEFGCGSGLLAAALPEGLEYLGVDRCDHLLKKARRRCPERSFKCFDVRTAKESADLAMAWSFMKHFAPREWAAVLGKVLSSGKRFGAFDAQVAGKTFDDGRAFPHCFVTERAVLSAVAAAGFAVENEEVFSEFTVGGEPAKNVAYWCRRLGEGEAPAEPTRPVSEKRSLRCNLVVGGELVTDLHRYGLRWVEKGPPALYRDGRRVTQAWDIELNVSVPEDHMGASA